MYERVADTLRAQPGVTGVTAAAVAAFAGGGWGQAVMVEGFEVRPDTDRYTRFNPVATGYFETLGIPVLAGRTFSDSDVFEAPRVAVVNEAFARKFDLGREAVGKRLGRGGLDAELDIEIVGLAADTRYNVKGPEPPVLYVPSRQEEGLGTLTFYARTALPPESLVRTVPALMAELDATLPVTDLKTLPQGGSRERVSRPDDLAAGGGVRRPRDAAGGHGALRRARLCGGAAQARDWPAHGPRRECRAGCVRWCSAKSDAWHSREARSGSRRRSGSGASRNRCSSRSTGCQRLSSPRR